MESAVGTVSALTGTGNFSVTGLAFKPKVLIVYSAMQPTGAGFEFRAGFGAAVSNTSRFAVWSIDDDAAGTSNSARSHTEAAVFSAIDENLVATANIDFVSFNADGFTLNRTIDAGVTILLNYLVLGGSTLTNVAIKHFTMPMAGAASVGYTGVGFKPDGILFFSSLAGGVIPGSSSTGWLNVGFASSATAMASANVRADDNSVAANTSHGQTTAAVLLDTDTANTYHKATLTSFDADGFTLNYSVANTHTPNTWALCLKGGDYKVGEITQKTSTGTQATTGLGFRPAAVLFMSTNDASNSDFEPHANLSVGAATSNTQQASIWAGSVDAVDPTQADRYQDSANVLRMMTAGTPTTEAVASFVSRDPDGFTLDWTTADSTARLIEYIAFGPLQGTGGGGGGGGRGGGGGNPNNPPGGGGKRDKGVLRKVRTLDNVL